MDCNTFNSICQIVNAIGALATFGAFIFLLLRDKDKQTQINKLAGIATMLEAQNDIMKQQNDLFSQQVEIFRNTSILKGQDDEGLAKLREIEEKKLKLSVMPKLWLNGAGYKGYAGELEIDLNNKGETAKLLDFKLKSDDIVLHDMALPYELDKGQRRYIFGRKNGNKHIKDCEYEIEIIYQDRLGTNYSSKISGKGANAKIDETKEF